MTEKPIPEQIIEDFLDKVSKTELLKKDRIVALKEVLKSEKVKKPDILKALKGDDKDENP